VTWSYFLISSLRGRCQIPPCSFTTFLANSTEDFGSGIGDFPISHAPEGNTNIPNDIPMKNPPFVLVKSPEFRRIPTLVQWFCHDFPYKFPSLREIPMIFPLKPPFCWGRFPWFSHFLIVWSPGHAAPRAILPPRASPRKRRTPEVESDGQELLKPLKLLGMWSLEQISGYVFWKTTGRITISG